MALVVQKYGGTSVADTTRIRNVANRVVKTYDQGNDVVVILSAMAGVTDKLLTLAHQATETPDRRELDVLLATGEQTTSAVLAMMLKGMGYQAQSLLGYQAEVVTDCEYGNAAFSRSAPTGSSVFWMSAGSSSSPVFRAWTSKATSPPWDAADRIPRPWLSPPP
nr:hypothetical protein [Desulfosarcina cetonica]